MRRLFVAGAHTDVGKTYVACALIRAMAPRGSVAALKPLVSGFDAADWSGSDPGRLIAAMGLEANLTTLEQVSPWRYAAPLAPPMAARLEGREVELDEVIDWCGRRTTEAGADLTLVEGVGGVMSPLTEQATNLDLIAGLGAPCLLVGGGYLGAISHTLTAVEAMRARGAAPLAVIVSESADLDAPDFAETVGTVARFVRDAPVFAASRNGDEAWAGVVLDLIETGKDA